MVDKYQYKYEKYKNKYLQLKGGKRGDECDGCFCLVFNRNILKCGASNCETEKHIYKLFHTEEIYEANKSIIKNPGLIHPGQVLYIPTLWIEHITSGKQFFVIFDKTKDKFDDSIYKGKSRFDPMGNLKGGETYSVSYKNNSFACTGYNQHYKKVGTWTYSSGNPSNSEISLWGRVYKFDIKGNLFDPEYGLVGHIAFSKSK